MFTVWVLCAVPSPAFVTLSQRRVWHYCSFILPLSASVSPVSSEASSISLTSIMCVTWFPPWSRSLTGYSCPSIAQFAFTVKHVTLKTRFRFCGEGRVHFLCSPFLCASHGIQISCQVIKKY